MNPNQRKLLHVTEWKVPAVVADWLWISIQTGEKKPFDPYIVPYQRQFNHKGAKPTEPQAAAKSLPKTDGPRESTPAAPVAGNEKAEASGGNPPPEPEHSERTDDLPLQEGSPRTPQQPEHSPSPAKERHPTPTPSASPVKRSARPMASEPETSAPLNMAISDLLKQKRNGSKLLASEKDTGPQRRRRLLGRANSNCSTLGAGQNPAQRQNQISRASSIDTMNEDGYGAVVDGIEGSANSSVGGQARADASDQPDVEGARDGWFDFMRGDPMFAEFTGRETPGFANEEDDNPPQMTQLGYEDPDAAAMREQILRHAERRKGGETAEITSGDFSEKKRRESGRNSGIGTLQDLEPAGWGSGRRTRSSKRERAE